MQLSHRGTHCLGRGALRIGGAGSVEMANRETEGHERDGASSI